MIRSVNAAQPLFFLDILRVRGLEARQGRLTVPVNPLHSIYARFEHVQGVPSPEGGVPLFRLRILDKLIDRLMQERRSVPPAGEIARLGSAELDSLIATLGARLQNRILELKSTFGGFAPETGMLLDLVA